MKATAKQEDGFKPVKLEIILETQAEVDEFFAVVDHSWFTDAFPTFNGLWNILSPFQTDGYEKPWNKLDKMFKEPYKG